VPGLDFPTSVPLRGNGTREIPFAIEDVMPGPCRLDAIALESEAVSGWMLTRATAGGRDIFDLTIDLSAAASWPTSS
jgi:hypothetical protein